MKAAKDKTSEMVKKSRVSVQKGYLHVRFTEMVTKMSIYFRSEVLSIRSNVQHRI